MRRLLTFRLRWLPDAGEPWSAARALPPLLLASPPLPICLLLLLPPPGPRNPPAAEDLGREEVPRPLPADREEVTRTGARLAPAEKEG